MGRRLYFIRQLKAYTCPDFYELSTDVWVFGDVPGYRFFQKCLERAKTARSNIHLPPPPRSHSMRVVIIPAAKSPKRGARLKIIERIVCKKREPEMELVFYGNRKGYDFLSRRFESMIEHSTDDSLGHAHVDDLHDREIVPRSVSLNIRGPLEKWSRKGLWIQDHFVYEKQETYLPAEAKQYSIKNDPYEEINPKTASFLRL